MLIVISPAKKFDSTLPEPAGRCTMPVFLPEAQELIDRLKQLSPGDIARLMKVSIRIAELNHRRYQSWRLPFTRSNARQAMRVFSGDVYIALGADDFDREDIGFAQKHLRMLSGLYGLLRPLDLIQAYRLEMGTKFPLRESGGLYQFWGDRITDRLADDLRSTRSSVLINLASLEYFKAIRTARLNARVITPVFRERKDGVYKTIGLLAKRARGAMSRYIVRHRIGDPEDIKRFRAQGYRYNKRLSSDADWVFTRG